MRKGAGSNIGLDPALLIPEAEWEDRSGLDSSMCLPMVAFEEVWSNRYKR